MNSIFRNRVLLVLFLSAVMLFASINAAAVGIKEIAAEEILEIRLFENPSTGYRWQLDLADNNYLQLLQEDYQPLAEKSKKNEKDQTQAEKPGTQILVGQGGIKSWIFRGLKEGCQLLTFELKRSGGEAEKTVEYLVMVE
mgnify:CR=1 FL=1